MNWDDLKIFRTVAKTGSLKKAADKLDLHHTSCARRLKVLETDLGTKLFDRLPSGYKLTEAGQRLSRSADVIYDEFNDIELDLTGKDTRLEGDIRITLPIGFATHLLMPAIHQFMQLYPDVHIDINMTYQVKDLAARDADIAIRHVDNPSYSLAGKRVVQIYRSAYASNQYLESHDPVNNPLDCHWLGWGDAENHLKWPQKKKFPTIPVRGNMYSDVLQLAAIQEHMGIASLPCFIGDVAPGIRRIPMAEAEPNDWIWVLAHRDMMSNARVRTFMNHIALAFEDHRDLLQGKITPKHIRKE